MKKSTKKPKVSDIKKKRIGRPPVGSIAVLVRIRPNLMKQLDKWNSGDLSRPEAIRHLVEFAMNPQSVDLRAQLAAVDGWIKKQKEPNLTRQAAICRLVEIGLKAKQK